MLIGVEQARTIKFTGRPIPEEVQAGDSQLTIVDANTVEGDGPLLGLPPTPPKFPDVLRQAVRGKAATMLAEPVAIW